MNYIFHSSLFSMKTVHEENTNTASITNNKESAPVDMIIPSTNIVLPGPFIVLQGIPGDGMRNTIDQSVPNISSHYDCNDDSEHNDAMEDDVMEYYVSTKESELISFNKNDKDDDDDIIAIVSRNGSEEESLDENDQNQHQQEPQQQQQQQLQQQQIRLLEAAWEQECRMKEVNQFIEWLESATVCNQQNHQQQRHHMTTACYSMNGTTNNADDDDDIHPCSDCWWMNVTNGELAMLQRIPQTISSSFSESSTAPTKKFSSDSFCSTKAIVAPILMSSVIQIGSLKPGIALNGIELVTVSSYDFNQVIDVTSNIVPNNDSMNNQPKNSRSNSLPYAFPHGRKGWIQFLKIKIPESKHNKNQSVKINDDKNNRVSSNNTAYVVYSIDGYTFLGPGLPQLYTNPTIMSLYRVTYPDGAYVRTGLDLSTDHIATIPYGSIVQVLQKQINEKGLSRLLIKAIIAQEAVETFTLKDSRVQQRESTTYQRKSVEGWCSEYLNPLAGQRGHILQPLPFPVPAIYEISCEHPGAIVRTGIELSSPQTSILPPGSKVHIVGRVYTENTINQCIERLRLAGCDENGATRYISVRLNIPYEIQSDHSSLLIAQVIDIIDQSLDFPNQPFLYHMQHCKINKYHHHLQQQHQQGIICNEQKQQQSYNDNRICMVQNTSAISSSITNGDDTNSSSLSLSKARSLSSDARDTISNTINQQHTLLFSSSDFRKPRWLHESFTLSDNMRRLSPINRKLYCSNEIMERTLSRKNNICLVCLSDERTATIVHGETGHIACCLVCARLLKARNDPCPVCRMDIDAIIQHYYA